MASSSSERPGELDLRGEVCPYTFVRTRLALEAMPLGAALAVLVDHEPATRNIPRSAREWGQEVAAVEPVAGGADLWRITLIKRCE
ncbi:MAG TPA: sulfurtransferase TusA family protein [Kofleriaceae bacterium]|nr:sulfurtransferase TusA family protein [Kofleriaceae bacterium]